MAEEEVNYTAVVFKNKNPSQSEVKKEEATVYDQIKGPNKGQTAELVPEKKADVLCSQYQLWTCSLGTLCVIFLLVVIALVIYITQISDKIHQNQQNQLNILEALNKNLTTENGNLKMNYNNVTTENENLKMSYNNLTQANTVLDNKVTNLTTENQKLQMKNQQLEMDKNNLTTQVQDLQTGMDLNISRSQWAVDQYCKNNAGGTCQSCQRDWILSGSCYAVNNAQPAERKTWEEAREDCREKISDLVVVTNGTEKTFVTDISWPINYQHIGYWLGLRVEGGKWKWVDGSDLTDEFWTPLPAPTPGQCAVSVPGNNQWSSVSCTEKKAWICKKKALHL